MSRPFRPRSRPSTVSASRRRSDHSDVTGKQHAEDKREQDRRKTSNWLRLEEEELTIPAPGVDGPFWGDAQGVSYRVIAGMAIECPPSELFELREKIRREEKSYQGRMNRKGRECWVPRPLHKPFDTTGLTLPPWCQAALKLCGREKQKSLMAKISVRVARIAEKTGREVIGLDWHADTDKLHCEIHTLRINRKTKRLIEMKTVSTWTLGADRKQRAGLLDPNSEEAKWLEANLTKGEGAVDIEMSRAIDEEVSKFIKEQGLEANVEVQKKDWSKITQAAKEKRILEKAASLSKAYLKVAGMGLLSAYAIGRIRELITGKERDQKIKEQMRVAAEMDRVS